MERQNCTEEQEHLEQQLKDLNSDITVKNKAIKDLEKEVWLQSLSYFLSKVEQCLKKKKCFK